jgi:hypothetical protein
LPAAREGDLVSYVLDGQQRLTSLFAILNGLSIVRPSGYTEDFSQVFIDLDATEDDEIVILDKGDRPAHTFIQLSELLHGTLIQLASYPETYWSKLEEYKKRIQGYEFPIIEVRNVLIDVATVIFTRINVSGKSLSVFEIMVAKTYDEVREFDLSVKFAELISRLTTVNYETLSNATLLQIVALILEKDCKAQTILKLKKDNFIDTWPRAIDGVERAIEYFRNVLRIPVSQLLPYLALVVPFAYYFYRHPDPPDHEHQKFLDDFFWRCSLGGRYSSSLESKLAQDIGRIDTILDGKAPEYETGVNTSAKFLIENGWFNASRSFVKAILCIFAYERPLSFRNNGIVNISNYWLKQANSKNYHHFFPRSYLRRLGIGDEKANNVINITIVDDYLNKREIGSKPPSVYMKKFADANPSLVSAMATHLIKDLEGFGIWSNNFDTFRERRAEAISQELRKRIIPRKIDELGQVVRADHLEEEMSDAELEII